MKLKFCIVFSFYSNKNYQEQSEPGTVFLWKQLRPNLFPPFAGNLKTYYDSTFKIMSIFLLLCGGGGFGGVMLIIS